MYAVTLHFLWLISKMLVLVEVHFSYFNKGDVYLISVENNKKFVWLQPIWDSIIDFDPQVFIWMGDNIYGDKRRPFKLFGKERTIGPWKNVPRFYPSSEQEMELEYKKAKSNPGYSRLRQKAKVTFQEC